MGPAALFGQLDNMLAELRKSGDSLLSVSTTSSDMFIQEEHLVALLAHAYVSKPRVAAIFGDTPLAETVKQMKKGTLWLLDEQKQREFFQTLWRLTNSLTEPAWMHGKDKVLTPAYEEVRANVRRAFYSLFYYRNISAANNLTEAFLVDSEGFSLLGHSNSTPSLLATPTEQAGVTPSLLATTEEQADDPKTKGLARIVATGVGTQPFVEKWRNLQKAKKKRLPGEAHLEECIERHKRAVKPPGECHPDYLRLQHEMSKYSHYNQSESQKAMNNLLMQEQEIVAEALRSDSPNEAWVNISMRNSANAVKNIELDGKLHEYGTIVNDE
jgi:hypothetical protein